MSTEPTEVVPAADAAPEVTAQQNAEPERTDAQLDADEHADQSGEAEGEKLTDEQKTIRKLQRRIERLNGKVGGKSREADMLREQLAQFQQSEEVEAEPDVERKATQRAHEIVKTQTLESKAQALLKEGKKLDGFEAAMTTLRDEVPFVDGKGRITPFLEAILESDAPAVLVKYLGDNPEEAAEFDGLSQVQIGRRLERLESKLSAGKTKVSSAPAPIKPLGGNGSRGVQNLESASAHDYEQMRLKQNPRWARR